MRNDEPSEARKTATGIDHWNPMPWRGQMITMRQGPTNPETLSRAIDRMIEADMNLLVIEVEKGLRYDSHPAVSAEWALAKKTLRDLVRTAERGGIKCVPLLPSLSHTGYIVDAYPQLAETAGKVCPRRERTKTILADLAAELVELFEPAFFHIGHDELLSAYPRHQRQSVLQCPLCRAETGANWFRDSILHWHDQLRSQSVGMMMWADMLLAPDSFRQTFSWSGSLHAVHGGPPDHFEAALDELPREIIMCDWHYEPGREYPSLRYLQDQGFDTLGCPQDRENSYLFTRYAQRTRTPHLLGMLGTNWDEVNDKTEARLLREIETNGGFFRGQDDPDLRAAAEAAETHRFGAGSFEHVVDFSRPDHGLLAAAWYDEFRANLPSSPGIGLKPGRNGKLCLPLIALPDCVFEQLEIELRTEAGFPGPGRTGISFDGGGTYTFRPLQKHTDWSMLTAGRRRLLWMLEVANQKSANAACLNSIWIRGRLTQSAKLGL